MASEAGRAAHAARVIQALADSTPGDGAVAVCGRVGDKNTLAAEGSERRPCAQCPEEVWASPATLALKPERFLCTTCAVTAAGAASPIKRAKAPRLSAVHRFAAAWADGVDLPPVGDIPPRPSGLDERTLRWCGQILSQLLGLAEGVDDAGALALAIDRVSEFYARQHVSTDMAQERFQEPAKTCAFAVELVDQLCGGLPPEQQAAWRTIRDALRPTEAT